MGWTPGTVQAYLDRWDVRRCGETVITPSSWLVPGHWRDRPVMLKVARVEEEARAGHDLAWWAGAGAVDIYNFTDQAVLMELASGQGELAAMCRAGRDDEVTHILCETIASLHKVSESSAAPAEVVPLSLWFRELVAPASSQIRAQNIERSAAVARDLLGGSGAHDAVVLHGDVHPGNVLDFDGRWLAVDPKGLLGPRGFDYGLSAVQFSPSTGDRQRALRTQYRRCPVVGRCLVRPFSQLDRRKRWSAMDRSRHPGRIRERSLNRIPVNQFQRNEQYLL